MISLADPSNNDILELIDTIIDEKDCSVMQATKTVHNLLQTDEWTLSELRALWELNQ